MRPLQWPRDVSLADIPDQGPLRRDVPVFSLKIVRRLAGPDIQNLVDRFKKHLVAIAIESAEQCRVRQKSTGAYSENPTSLEHVIEHCHAGGDGGRMGVRHVNRAGTQLDLLGSGCDPRDERDARTDVLGSVRDVFADIALGAPHFVAYPQGSPLFFPRYPPI